MRKKDCSMIYWHLKVITMYKISFSILHLQFLHILFFFFVTQIHFLYIVLYGVAGTEAS